ncbi:MAG: tetratricopeptide repeat protein [Planctomycetes bacterium]|nr:tetratricopeptide repeat protein [Planctomycetota bacterium]
MNRILCLILAAACAAPLAAQGDAKDAWALFSRRDYAPALERFERELRLYPDWEVLHDAMGWCHYFLGDYDQAAAKFRDALSRKSDYRWSLEGLEAVAAVKEAPLAGAQALLAAGRYVEARIEFQRIQAGATAAGADAVADALIGEGWCLSSLGRQREAIAVFRKALKERRGAAEAYRGIAYGEYALGDHRSALASFELSFQAEPDDVLARLTAAWCHYADRDYRKGLLAFEAALKLAPDDYRPSYGRAWCLHQLGKDGEALTGFQRAVDLSPYAMTADLRALVDSLPDWQGLYERTGWAALRARLDSWAQTEFEAAGKLDPEAIGPRAGLAYALFRLGSYDRAARLAASLGGAASSASFPVSLADGTVAEAEMNMASLEGWCAYRLGLYDKAVAAFRKVRSAHPGWVDPVCGEGWTLYSQGNFPAAEAAFASAARLVPGYPDAVSGAAAVSAWRYAEYTDAWSQFDAGAYAAAAGAFRALLDRPGARFPAESEPLLRASLGWSLFYGGQSEEASAAFERALVLDSSCVLAHRGLAYLLVARGDHSKAEAHFAAAAADPAWSGNAELLAAFGWCLLEGRDAEAAETRFREALAADRNCAAALAGLGVCQMRIGEMVEARVSWQRALTFDPTLAGRGGLQERMEREPELQKLHAVLGWAWLQRGDAALAEAQFRKALERDPLEPTLDRGLGLALLRGGRLEEAREQLESWLKGAPKKENPWGGWSSTLSELAWALQAAGQDKAALGLFRRLAALHLGEKREYADPHDGAGWCLLGQGKLRDAKKEFLAAIAIEPRYEHSLQGLEALQELE